MRSFHPKKAYGHDMINTRMVKNCEDSICKHLKLIFQPCSFSAKILAWLLYDKMFDFFTENNLISESQSGFKPGDLCINQFLLSLMKFINLLIVILKSELVF